MNSEEKNLDYESLEVQPKSFSLKVFPRQVQSEDVLQKKPRSNTDFVIQPKLFVPRLRPKQAKISPSPMILGVKPRSFCTLRDEKFSLKTSDDTTFKEECSSDCGSDEEEVIVEGGEACEEKSSSPEMTINRMRKMLTKMKPKKNKKERKLYEDIIKGKVSSYINNKYFGEPLTIKETRMITRRRSDNEVRAYSILDVLRISSKTIIL